MIIFNHPSFLGQFRGFAAPDAATLACLGECHRYRSARNRRFIKPNKTESPKPRNSQIVIEECGVRSQRHCSKELPSLLPISNYKKELKMTVWEVLGLVILAGFAAVALLAILLNRARKAIDEMKLDPERL